MSDHRKIILLSLEEYKDLGFEETDIDTISHLFFCDSSNTSSKRLTSWGWKILGNIFESHSVDLPDDYMQSGRDIIYFEKKMNSIYYIDYRKKKIHLFDGEDALLLKMYGSPDTMIEAEGFSVLQ